MPRQLWIPDVLKTAGLTVRTALGWETRGTTTFDPIGVMWHHTASGKNWSEQSLINLLANGRPDLKGPLCHLQLNRDGSYVVIAAGRANHAGTGKWGGITTGNTSFIGIEAANDGVGEPWPQIQLEAYHIGTAALLKHINGSVDNVIGHKEWTTRKIDPRGIDMNEARARVSDIISGRPSGAPNLPSGVQWGQGGLPNIPSALQRPLIRYGSSGGDVRAAQQMLVKHSLEVGRPDGIFGPMTFSAVKRFQAEKGLKIDGVIGSVTWEALERSPGQTKNTPTQPAPQQVATKPVISIHERCKRQVLRVGSRDNCVASLQRALNSLGFDAGTPDGSFGPRTEAAARRFQTANRINSDGIVGPQTWSKF